MKQLLNKNLQKGFTLIELLVVIVVLGVLAATILVALNPVEQKRRADDASRQSTVAQLGRAAQAWSTSQQVDISTLAAADWQTTLVENGEIKQAIKVQPALTQCNTNMDGGVCISGTSPNVIIWTVLESISEKKRGGCDTTNKIAIAAWDSSLGRGGIKCVAEATTAPAIGDTTNRLR